MIRVKVCGVTNADDRDAVVDAGADALGVIANVPVDTPREVPREAAADLLAGVPPFVTGVLVTMPQSVQKAVRLVDTVGPAAVQIHGGLAPDQVATLSRRIDRPVIAAVDAESAEIDAYAAAADAVLVDSVDADGGGGTGQTHDWTRTREHVASLDVPVILAGGLTPDNVAGAVETVTPFGVDVASGVEAAPGRKDHDAVTRFVTNARGQAPEGRQ
jgi:phosphoribosylanthranilate isomerase